MAELYKEGLFYRSRSPQWEIDDYGEAVNGKGDLIFNTCAKLIDDKAEDRLHARLMIAKCRELLLEGKRWPDEMNQACDAKTRIRWRWSQLCKWLYLVKTVKYRSQNSLTRDPFIALYTAYMIYSEHAEFFIENAPIPIRLFTPGVWAWRRYLINPNIWSYLIYEILKYKGDKDYVKRLQKYMDIAVAIKNKKK